LTFNELLLSGLRNHSLDEQSIARRELEHEFELQRTLNVDMQFCFWNLLNKRLHQALRDGFDKGVLKSRNLSLIFLSSKRTRLYNTFS